MKTARIAPAPATAASAAASTDRFAWNGEWTYFAVVIGLFVLVPGLRRIIDWRAGAFGPIQILSIIPLLSLFGFSRLVWLRRMRLSRPMRTLLIVWFAVFAYALVIAIFSSNVASGAYEFAAYGMNALAGVWIATLDLPPKIVMRRIGTIVIIAVTVSAVYGIYQYIDPPAWDIFWIISSEYDSMGKPEPFGLRIFSTLNSTGPFANTCVVGILFAFGFLRARTLWLLAPMALCLAALALTLVRADWLAIIVGLVAYVVISPYIARSLPTLAIVAGLAVLMVVALPTYLGASNASAVTDRLTTLSDPDSDVSVQDRRNEIHDAYVYAAAKGTGDGLGVLGTSAKLGSAGDTIVLDSGYLARFVEFGYFGFLGYVVVTIGAIGVGVVRAARTRHSDPELSNAYAIASAIIVVFAFMDAAYDSHYGIEGLFFWISVGFVGTPAVAPALAARVARARRPLSRT